MIRKPDKVWDINLNEYLITGEPVIELDGHYAVFAAKGSSEEYYVKLFEYLNAFELDSFYERLDRCAESCKDCIIPYIPLRRPYFMGYLIPKKESIRRFSDLKNSMSAKRKLVGLYMLARLLHRLDENGFAVCGSDESAFIGFRANEVLIGSPECVYRKGALCMSTGRVLQRAPEAMCESGHIADWQEASYIFALMTCSYLGRVPSYYNIGNAGEALELLRASKRLETPKDDEFEFEDDDPEIEINTAEKKPDKSDEELLEELVFGNKIAPVFDENASDVVRENGGTIELISARLKQMIVAAMNADTVHSIRPDFKEWMEAIKECFRNLVKCYKCGSAFLYVQDGTCPMCGTSSCRALSVTVQELFDVSEFNKTIWYPYEKRMRFVKLTEPRLTIAVECDGKDVSVSGKDIGLNRAGSSVLRLNYSDNKLSVTMLMGEEAKVADFTGKIDVLQKGIEYGMPILNGTLNSARVIFKIGEQCYRFTFKAI